MVDKPETKTLAEMTDAERADLQRSLLIIEEAVDLKILSRIDRLFINSDVPTVLATLAKVQAKALAFAGQHHSISLADLGRVYLDYAIIVASHMTVSTAPERKDH